MFQPEKVIAHSMDTIYQKLIDQIMIHGQKVDDTMELLNVSFTLTNPLNNLVSVRDISLRYLFGELIFNLQKDNSLKFISKFSKMWERLSDDNKTVNSAYGYIIHRKHEYDQLRTAIHELKLFRDSRRAIININTPNETYSSSNDVPCTLTIQFLIRNNHLHMIVNMRSNDMYFGLPYDAPYFIMLQLQVLKEYNAMCVTQDQLIKLGTYTHNAASLHIYDKDRKVVCDARYKKHRKHRFDYEPLIQHQNELFTLFNADIDRLIPIENYIKAYQILKPEVEDNEN